MHDVEELQWQRQREWNATRVHRVNRVAEDGVAKRVACRTGQAKVLGLTAPQYLNLIIIYLPFTFYYTI